MANFKPRYCKICGREFMPTARNNTICPMESCQKMRVSLNRKDYEKRRKEKLIRERNNSFVDMSDLVEVSRKARELGMSYGKYVLMIQQKIM